MGLTIHYRFRLKASPDEARSLVSRAHAFAATQPFGAISAITEWDPPDKRRVFPRPPAECREWKPGMIYLPRKSQAGTDDMVQVPSLHVISFGANSDGAETAEFGLASHPPVVVH